MQTSVQYYDFKAGLPSEFEIVDLAAIYEQHREKITTPHRTGFYHIIWFREGGTEHWVDFTPIDVQAGTLLFISKDRVQQFSEKTNGGKAILFTDSFFAQHTEALSFLRSTILFNDLLAIARIAIEEKGTDPLASVLRLMETEVRNGADNYQTSVLLTLLFTFLLLSERAYRGQGFQAINKSADLDYTVLFKELLDKQYKQSRLAGYYADSLHLTEKRLKKATEQTLGKAPKQLIDERVNLEAKRLLAHTVLSVKEIGYELGFDEPTNFVKYFKKHCKLTPAEFREQFSR